jgi:hypothetical protein
MDSSRSNDTNGLGNSTVIILEFFQATLGLQRPQQLHAQLDHGTTQKV